ncbi:MAG: hypothetical protein IJ193_04235 [Bacilli bacterium]|nr:hypothetical protein [Bacilli bacterium]
MYSVSKKKNNNKLDNFEILNLDGFLMSSKNGFKIHNQVIKDIRIVDSDIAHRIVADRVKIRYEKLIEYLTDVLTGDDDSGDSMHEALNQIERFRLEIKNKYRHYLKKLELQKMSKQLMTLKKELEKEILEIEEARIHLTNGKGK